MIPGADKESAACPKQMTFGPCGGVDPDGSCEVPGVGRCAFLDVPLAEGPYADIVAPRPWPSSRPTPGTRFVVADLPAAPLSSASLRAAAGALAGSVDACLLGDHGAARVQFPPSHRTRLLAEAGLPVWAGINCRDRNRVALEGEIAACVDAGAVGVHCVTGDHTALGTRSDAMPVFDLDAVELVALAAEHTAGRTGQHEVRCSVAHSPTAPPREVRLPRLLAKIAAGADTVVIDHCGGPDAVATVTADLRDTGFGGTVVACVPIALDTESASVLLSFAASRVPSGYVEQILAATDPRRAGIEAATHLAVAMLAIPGVDGVNLSGGARPGDEVPVAEAFAEIARGIRAGARAVPA